MSESLYKKVVSTLLDNKVALTALVVLVLISLGALFAPFIAPQNPYDLAALNLEDSRLAPASKGATSFWYVLGSDDQGRDMLSAILFGLRTSLWIGVASTVIALFLGGTLGLLAGYHGGKVDALIMRVADLQLSFPAILIALILLAVLGQGAEKILTALVAVQWAFYARTARSAALVERNKEYVEAAVCLGFTTRQIVFKQVLPNCLPPLIVVAALQVASAISLEATLSFLGIGLPITEPSLGLLIANGFQYMLSGSYWISFYPGIALLLTVMAINLVADHLRDVLNPKLQTL